MAGDTAAAVAAFLRACAKAGVDVSVWNRTVRLKAVHQLGDVGAMVWDVSDLPGLP